MHELIWDEPTWRARAAEHRRRVAGWTRPHRERTRAGRRHPVLDFLFIYDRSARLAPLRTAGQQSSYTALSSADTGVPVRNPWHRLASADGLTRTASGLLEINSGQGEAGRDDRRLSPRGRTGPRDQLRDPAQTDVMKPGIRLE
ncbi:MAG TPA: hypothetical protein VGH99_11500 [Pseudonocardia sp.]|jgi:hypothetical protein